MLKPYISVLCCLLPRSWNGWMDGIDGYHRQRSVLLMYGSSSYKAGKKDNFRFWSVSTAEIAYKSTYYKNHTLPSSTD